ncbi:glycosyltransferase family protein [Nocardiopsis nanhaiensis]
MRLRSIPRKQVVLVAVALVTVAVALSPPRMALVLAFAGLASLTLWVASLVERQGERRSRELDRVRSELARMDGDRRDELSIARKRDVRVRKTIREATEQAVQRVSEGWEQRDRAKGPEGVVSAQGNQRLSTAQDLLWTGFSSLGLAQLNGLGSDTEVGPPVRAEAHKTLSNWYRATGEPEHARNHAHLADLAAPRPARDSSGVPLLLTSRVRPSSHDRHFDVVVMSDFRLPGGTTSSNLQEITAQRRAGLRTGLVHHPALRGDHAHGINPKVLAAVDNDLVRFVAPDERVTCDLLVARFPLIGQQPLDVLPSVEAARRIVVVNQTPDRRYGAGSPRYEAWDVARCAEGFTNLLGEHSWYPISPRVREAMVRHHAEEMAGIPLAADDWTNIIDLDSWRRAGPRAPDGRVLVGRHSRDDRDKWPEDPATLAMVHPLLPGWETHVLGGTSHAERAMGLLPDHWTAHPFDSMDVRDFLHGLDVYVYFTGEGYLEPFGRAPLEAIAVGLPTLLPHSFAPVFGDAAVYTVPEGVPGEVEALMTDGKRYAQQVKRGHEVLHEWFSHQTHLRRLARLGVRVPEEHLEGPRALALR